VVNAKPLVLLTGASTGLGLVLAKELICQDQYRLVLTARQKSIPRFAAEGIFESEDVFIRPLDITLREDRFAIISECEEQLGGLDILINNAGVALRSVVEDATADDRIGILEVNYIGPMRLIGLALPGMRKRRRGRIINVSSAAGLIGMPTMACYCGSKFALEGATESLWYEVRPWHINVSLVIPGFIHSDSFLKTLTTDRSQEVIDTGEREPYFRHYENMERLISWTMKHTFATPESVSRKIIKVMKAKRPKLRHPVTADAWCLFLFRKVLPATIYHWVMYFALPKSQNWGDPSSQKVATIPPTREA
jgi:short-subunit dehydrogenase